MSTFTVKDSSEFQISVNGRQNGVSEKFVSQIWVAVLSLSALGSDAQYSRSDPSDLDMVKIKAKLPLYDHDSRSDLLTAVQICPAAKKMTWKL